ncbi:hypothetical protein HUG15_04230 [Salicibibacter cibarius]|uniref:Uncharacterized protein n=1 Tax=Salicibibacter cibarius TaxID=2743000 RepID=A0A7T6Z1B3_9BACI|nr:hypothetical protein HUG15_04230 [Salicibibacter cibarius]
MSAMYLLYLVNGIEFEKKAKINIYGKAFAQLLKGRIFMEFKHVTVAGRTLGSQIAGIESAEGFYKYLNPSYENEDFLE